jgi:hypothetical protein
MPVAAISIPQMPSVQVNALAIDKKDEDFRIDWNAQTTSLKVEQKSWVKGFVAGDDDGDAGLGPNSTLRVTVPILTGVTQRP